MDPVNLPTPSGLPTSPGELVAQNGRAAGSRRTLLDPLTLVGQASSCDLRVGGDGVLPLHCAIFRDPAGPVLRDLGSADGTRVNGKLVSVHRLVNGDVIEVGTNAFVFHADPVTAEVPSAEAVLGERDREALRIQAAAVVAQQVALDEVEGRLEQRAASLTRQEEQLAAHLEQRQHDIDEQESGVQQRHASLTEEADRLREQTEGDRREAERRRREVSTESARLEKERQEIEATRAQLRKQFERQFSAKEAELARREADLKDDRQRLDEERQRVQSFHERINTERELGRRQLRAEWQELALERQRWEEALEAERSDQERQRRELQLLAAEASAARDALVAQQRDGEVHLVRLAREADGLEARIVNARARLAATGRETPTSPAPSSLEPIIPPADWSEPIAPEHLLRANAELMDQRARLAEQWEKFLRVQQTWEEDRLAVLEALEADAAALDQGQRRLDQGERELAGDRLSLERQQEIIAQRRVRLEGAQVRLLAEQAERTARAESLQVELDGRERLVGQRLHHLDEIHRRRHERRLAEVARLGECRSRTEEARRQYSALYQDCERLCQEWTRQERVLAARGLALEQYRLDLVQKSADSARAEAQIAKLERVELTRHDKESRRVEEARESLLAERRSLDEMAARLRKQEEILLDSLREWELAQARREAEQGDDREKASRLEEVRRLRAQRAIDERQLRQLSEELERVARALIEDGEEPPSLAVAAA